MRAERAIPVASRMARASGGALRFLRVVSTPREIGSQVVPLSAYAPPTPEAAIEAAQSYLATRRALEALDGISLNMLVSVGTAAQPSHDVVSPPQADLFVLCSYG